MKDFILKHKNELLWGAVALVIFILIIVIVIISRKKQAEKAPLPKQTDWGRTLTDVEEAQVIRLTDGLYEDMKGWNIWGHNESVYTEYSQTTDRVFVAVANHFGEKYGNGESLAQWMKDEAYTFNSLTDAIMSRLAKFGFIAS